MLLEPLIEKQNATCVIQQYYNGLKTPVFLCEDGDIVWYNIAADDLIKNVNFKSCITQIIFPQYEEDLQFITCSGVQYKVLIRPYCEDFFVEVIEIKKIKLDIGSYKLIGGIESMENTIRMSTHKIFQSISFLGDIFEKIRKYDILEHLDSISDGAYKILRAANLYYEYNLLLKNDIKLEVVDIFSEIEALCSSIKSIMNRSLTAFTWFIPKGKLFCNVDMHKLSFALFHLVCNSYCFTSDKNEIELKLENIEGKYVQIQVIDSGCGVSIENLNKIFEPFYSYNPLTGDIAGCGLGLTYAKDLIDKLGGTLNFSSSTSKTVVSIMLPVKFFSNSMGLSSSVKKYKIEKYDNMVSTMATLGINSNIELN